MLSIDEIVEIFEWIEMLLIGSLKRNLTRHEAEEKKYGFNWTAWQAEKLRNLDKFRRENAAIVGKYTNTIDKNTRALLEEQFREGVNGAAQEAGEAPEPQPVYKQDIQPTQPELPEQPEQPQEQPTPETDAESTEPPTATDEPIAVIKPEPQFFGVDTVKVNKLVEDMTTMEKQAEMAALRLTDDVYRQTVNRVQLAMSTGSMTLNKAIDTAVEDFLNAGINCIEYKDGRRVNIADYVRMALRTTSTRAALQGKSEKYKALGYDTVLVSSYGMCSQTCLPYQGRVYINDAFTSWTGETELRADGLTYGKSHYCGKWFPLLSSAIAGGLFHPNCRHSITLWRDGDSLPEPIDNSETESRYKLEQQQRALEREIRRAKRRVEGFTDPEDVAMAKAQLKEKQKQLREFIDKTNAEEGAEILRRDSSREKVYNKNEIDFLQGSSEINFGRLDGSKPISADFAEEYRNEYEKFTTIFGEMPNLRAVNIAPYQGGGVYGGFNPNSSEITLLGVGGKHGKSFMQGVSNSEKKSGQWSTGSVFHSFRHELGHALQQCHEMSDPMWNNKLVEIEKIRNNLENQLTELSESDKMLFKKNKLSRYGFESTKEFISESIAEYANNPKKARATARSVVDIILRKE